MEKEWIGLTSSGNKNNAVLVLSNNADAVQSVVHRSGTSLERDT